MEVNVKMVTAKCVLLGNRQCSEEIGQYEVTIQVVRSVTEVARYTKVQIRYDILMSGKL